MHPSANLWPKQFAEDIKALKKLDCGESLLEETGGNALTLFTDKAERFQKLDLDEFRAACWATCFSPLGAGEAPAVEE